MPNFRSTVESMLANGATAVERKDLHQEVRAAQPIVGMALPHLDSIYMLSGWGRQTVSVRTVHTPDILCLKCCYLANGSERQEQKLRNSFYPRAVAANTRHDTVCTAWKYLNFNTNAYNMALRILYMVNDTIMYSDTMFIHFKESTRSDLINLFIILI